MPAMLEHARDPVMVALGSPTHGPARTTQQIYPKVLLKKKAIHAGVSKAVIERERSASLVAASEPTRGGSWAWCPGQEIQRRVCRRNRPPESSRDHCNEVTSDTTGSVGATSSLVERSACGRVFMDIVHGTVRQDRVGRFGRRSQSVSMQVCGTSSRSESLCQHHGACSIIVHVLYAIYGRRQSVNGARRSRNGAVNLMSSHQLGPRYLQETL